VLAEATPKMAMNEKSATETSEWLYEAVIRFLQVRYRRHGGPHLISPLFPPPETRNLSRRDANNLPLPDAPMYRDRCIRRR